MSENIKEALEYAVGLREDQEVLYKIDGKNYFDGSKATLKELEPIKYASELTVNSLSGLVDYLKSKFDTKNGETPEKLLIHVASPTKVYVYSALNADRKRECLISAEALLDKFPYKRFLASEDFIINVQSLIQRDLDAEAILAYASAIRIEGGGDLTDNGVSQTVTVKQGASSKATAEVPSPASLRPYRTFLEIEQPSSPFVFRINKNGDCALFEADGGIWKHIALDNISEYLTVALKEELAQKLVTIIA